MAQTEQTTFVVQAIEKGFDQVVQKLAKVEKAQKKVGNASKKAGRQVDLYGRKMRGAADMSSNATKNFSNTHLYNTFISITCWLSVPATNGDETRRCSTPSGADPRPAPAHSGQVNLDPGGGARSLSGRGRGGRRWTSGGRGWSSRPGAHSYEKIQHRRLCGGAGDDFREGADPFWWS